MERSIGTTSRQMQMAPLEAYYVWPEPRSQGYAIELAEHVGRGDLKITTPGRLFNRMNLKGRGEPLVYVLDHATVLSPEEDEARSRHEHRFIAGGRVGPVVQLQAPKPMPDVVIQKATVAEDYSIIAMLHSNADVWTGRIIDRRASLVTAVQEVARRYHSHYHVTVLQPWDGKCMYLTTTPKPA